MSERLDTELPQTLLFDHPTLQSIADSLLLDNDSFFEVENQPDEYPSDNGAAKSIWDLYSELKQEKTDELFVPPAAKSARRAVVLFSFPGSGLEQFLSQLRTHSHLCVCEDLCLMPFKTLAERNDVLSSRRDNLQDGLIDTVKTLRNCKLPDIRHIFGTVANTYRAMQEWCAPRILIDGTDAYYATAKLSFSEANNLWSNAFFVHLLRNPRGCLGEWQNTIGANNLDRA